MKRTRLILILSVFFFLWFALTSGISLYIDSLWFDSLGYSIIFTTTLWYRFLFWIGGFALAFAILGINLRLATRRSFGGYWFREDLMLLARTGSNYLFWIALLVLSALIGLAAQARWMSFLQYWHQAPSGITDPVFGKDISFYFFSVPFLSFVTSFGLALVLVSVVVAAFSYVIHGHLGYDQRLRFTPAARIHLTILLALGFFLLALRFWLARFDILYGRTGFIFGASYTDIYAWLPSYWILIVLAAASGLLFLISLFLRSIRLPVAVAVVFVAVYFLIGAYPLLIQNFVVEPNELARERPFIENSIRYTRQAYDLNRVEVQEFSPSGRLTDEQISANQATLQNIRLWDWRPLMDAYGQLQALRQYYAFHDVDIDRYNIEGDYRQVTLAARELDFSTIAERTQSWINKHFQFTHGYGVVLSPVNEVTEEGLPSFFIQDIPPHSSVDLQITRPEIYFGERTTHPVFVKTDMQEFDYPAGDENVYATYQADSGLEIGSFFRKLLFAWELGQRQIILDNPLTEESRVLLYRQIQERVSKIAPFLYYDHDPYVVISEGRLFWIQDAYTVTDRYPYSEPYLSQATANVRTAQRSRFNYIRNSVKVVIDAYSGDVTFYLAYPEDPLIQTYMRIFPGVFTSLSEMPEGLRDNIRYPEDIFNIQRDIFRTYHMQDPTVFYNREDVWEIPTEVYRGNEQIMDSYYLVMSLPKMPAREEFVLLIPYTPRDKNNMIAWLAARSDGENYGRLVLYQFPKQELIYGPMQVEARIDQDPRISQLITLWSQEGSRVIRGNLLVIPIENSLLYVEPLYLQAERSEIPELTRIIVVYQNRVAIGETLQEALDQAIGGAPPEDLLQLTSLEGRTPQPTPAAPAAPLAQDLPGQALQHYRNSQEYLRQGNWAAYGEEQRRLGEVLQQIQNQ
ncbi:MAG: UPF0182 family protein [Acidobacteriota bacterium]